MSRYRLRRKRKRQGGIGIAVLAVIGYRLAWQYAEEEYGNDSTSRTSRTSRWSTEEEYESEEEYDDRALRGTDLAGSEGVGA
eukprot:2318911-Rhodomonas_salina.1